MSYISLLQEHANNLKNNIDAGQEREEVGASQKAQGLAEKYQEVLDHYNAGAGAISTMSGAFHQGRKIYRGYSKQAASRAAAKTQPLTSAPENAKGTPVEAAPAPAQEPAAAEVDQAANPNARTGQGFKNLVERGARQAPFQRRTDVQQADTDEADLRETPLTDTQMKQYSATSRFSSTPADRLGEPEAGSALHGQPENTKLVSGRYRQGLQGDDLSGDIGNPAPKSLGSSFTAKSAADIGEDTSKVASTAAKAGNAAAKVAGSVGTEGLEAAGFGALDAIPIVGELAGAGLGLYSLFHGLSDHPPSAQDLLAKAPTASEGSAIDPSALLGKT